MAIITDGKKTVTLRLDSESEEYTSTVSQYPIQSGNPVTDHTQRSASTWTFTGRIYGTQSQINNAWWALMTWNERGTLVRFQGMIYKGGLMISDLKKSYSGATNAIDVELTLTEVRTVSTSYTGTRHVGPVAPKVTRKSRKSVAVYVTVRPGNTYWGWWRQYGTPIQTLRNWNHWPDRRIPVGAKARVK